MTAETIHKICRVGWSFALMTRRYFWRVWKIDFVRHRGRLHRQTYHRWDYFKDSFPFIIYRKNGCFPINLFHTSCNVHLTRTSLQLHEYLLARKNSTYEFYRVSQKNHASHVHASHVLVYQHCMLSVKSRLVCRLSGLAAFV